MDLTTSTKGMLDARERLRGRDGISQPHLISEQMQRLASYTSAVEEHLADLEEELEIEEEKAYRRHLEAGKSSNAAEKEAKYDVAKLKGSTKKLTRYVNSSWKLVSTSQSRHNHLESQLKADNHAV